MGEYPAKTQDWITQVLQVKLYMMKSCEGIWLMLMLVADEIETIEIA